MIEEEDRMGRLKLSIDQYRTFGGERYEAWCSGWAEEVLDAVASALREGGVKCRRLGIDLYVRKSDFAKAARLAADTPEACDPERVAMMGATTLKS